MQAPIKILVFHRNCLFRDCLTSFLTSACEYAALAVDHTRAEQPDALCTESAELILLDLNLPDNLAVEVTKFVRETRPNIKVVLLVPEDHRELVTCISAGVHGCVLESSSLPELEQAIEKVLLGETICSSAFAATMFMELSRIAESPVWKIPTAMAECRLTTREQQVLELMAGRKSNKEIAKELSVSLFTVKNHVHNILEKLNVESRLDAVDIARRENWVSYS